MLLFEYKIGTQLNNTSLVVEQNSCVTKTEIAYIVYDLNNWSKIPLRNFTLKNFLFGTAKIMEKSKYVCRGYGIAFDGEDKWNFSDCVRKMVISFTRYFFKQF